MKYVGFIICIAGASLLGYAFTMDTTLPVNYISNDYNLPNRVNNIGLVADKQNYMIFGAVLFALGLFTISVYDKKDSK